MHVVGAQLRLNRFGIEDPGQPPRPAYAYGERSIEIGYGGRALTVTATPEHEIALPGQETSIAVSVADVNGGAVAGAEICLVVVDDAVLTLAGYQLRSPIASFYPCAFISIRLSPVWRRGVVV